MSRYPAMSQAQPVPYDRSLLAGAPAPTAQERQAGYSVDALERGTYAVPQTNRRSFNAPPPPGAALPTDDPFVDTYQERPMSASPDQTAQKRPWYKRKRWIVLAAIVFLGILCGIIAGVVSARNSRNTTLLTDNNTSANNAAAGSAPISSAPSTPSTPTQVAGPAPTTSAGLSAGGNTSVGGGGNGSGNPSAGSTITFGASPQPPDTLPSGVVLPTATAQDPAETPSICYSFPHLKACQPYTEDPPR